jgi:hypothetical protein
MFFNPEGELERLTEEFQEAKAKVWADPALSLDEKNPAIYRLWQDFDQQRKELQSAAGGGATGEKHASPRRPFLPRSRRRLWK